MKSFVDKVQTVFSLEIGNLHVLGPDAGQGLALGVGTTTAVQGDGRALGYGLGRTSISSRGVVGPGVGGDGDGIGRRGEPVRAIRVAGIGYDQGKYQHRILRSHVQCGFFPDRFS